MVKANDRFQMFTPALPTLQFFNNVFAFAVCAAWRQLLRPQLQCWLMMRFGPGVMHVGMQRSKKSSYSSVLVAQAGAIKETNKIQVIFDTFSISHMNMLDSHQTIP